MYSVHTNCSRIVQYQLLVTLLLCMVALCVCVCVCVRGKEGVIKRVYIYNTTILWYTKSLPCARAQQRGGVIVLYVGRSVCLFVCTKS